MATPNDTQIPLTQRAAVLTECGQPYIVKRDYPVAQPSELKPNECLINLEFAGVCHSDLHIKQGAWATLTQPRLPLVGGHEGIGRIVAIGQNSHPGSLQVGARVGVKWIGDVCHRCEMCRKGNESACDVSFQIVHGVSTPGTFQEYVVSFLDYVTPIPEELDGASGTPILCAGLTVYKALKQANLTIGEWVAIAGAGGGLGHLAVQYASAMGLRVLAIDTGEQKRDLVLRLGAEKWVDFRESGENLVRDVCAATSGGPQGAIIAAGDPRPMAQALFYLRRTGVLVAVGLPAGEGVLNISIPIIVAKSLSIIGSAIGSQQDAIEAINIAALGKVKCQIEVRELEDINEVFDDMEAGKINGRVVIRLASTLPGYR